MRDRDAERALREDPPTLSFDDAVRFFTSKTPDGNCFACGTDVWNISTSEEDDGYCFFRKAGGSSLGSRAYNLDIECANCGMVRSHRADVLLNWLSQNPLTKSAREHEND